MSRTNMVEGNNEQRPGTQIHSLPSTSAAVRTYEYPPSFFPKSASLEPQRSMMANHSEDVDARMHDECRRRWLVAT